MSKEVKHEEWRLVGANTFVANGKEISTPTHVQARYRDSQDRRCTDIICEINPRRLDCAHLIAAAPVMKEALENFLEEYVQLVNSGDAGYWDAEKEPKVIAARAALALANGEEK